MAQATLIFQLTAAQEAIPVEGASVTVTCNGLEYPLYTDLSGRTEPLLLDAPDNSLSQYPDDIPAYTTCSAAVSAEGYQPVLISGIPLYGGITSIQPVEMVPVPRGRAVPEAAVVEIPPPAVTQTVERNPDSIPLSYQYGVEPRILSRVYIPAFITVHLGAPSSNASNVTVSFQNYIKNVASSEIYPTWPDRALRANILAQISFAMNRVYTEWYPSQGYSFNITNNTAYDQYFVNGRNIFENISRIVDELFNTYIRRQGTINPLFALYCNGTTVTCSGLSQWGSVSLAQNGYTTLNILKRYYGWDIELYTNNNIQNIESSYPGTPLRQGTVSPAVRILETQLNRIRRNYPAIPNITAVDNTFTSETADAVRAFQRIFNLTPDGIVGPATWNRISYVYSSVKRLAEVDSEGETESIPSNIPSETIRQGSRGETVRLAQYLLRAISQFDTSVRSVAMDGIFGPNTKAAVQDFQRTYGLTADGIIGPVTWNALMNAFLGIADTSGLVVDYPGYALSEGSRGDNVYLMQSYLQRLARSYNIPSITPDGIFGPRTRQAVTAFQTIAGIAADGIIGPETWKRIVAARLLV